MTSGQHSAGNRFLPETRIVRLATEQPDPAHPGSLRGTGWTGKRDKDRI